MLPLLIQRLHSIDILSADIPFCTQLIRSYGMNGMIGFMQPFSALHTIVARRYVSCSVEFIASLPAYLIVESQSEENMKNVWA